MYVVIFSLHSFLFVILMIFFSNFNIFILFSMNGFVGLGARDRDAFFSLSLVGLAFLNFVIFQLNSVCTPLY